MSGAILFALAVTGFALAAGLWAALAEQPDLHTLARAFADRTASLARRFGARGTEEPAGVAARVVAAMRFEIASLAAAAAPGEGAATDAQEARLRQACAEVAARIYQDARRPQERAG